MSATILHEQKLRFDEQFADLRAFIVATRAPVADVPRSGYMSRPNDQPAEVTRLREALAMLDRENAFFGATDLKPLLRAANSIANAIENVRRDVLLDLTPRPVKRPQQRQIAPKLKRRLREESPRCIYCGCAARPDEMTVDHVKPKARGGSNDVSNLAVACRSCNQSKGDRSPLRWASDILAAATEHRIANAMRRAIETTKGGVPCMDS